MVPEVIQGNSYSLTADIRNLCCVMYELLTLRPPFASHHMTDLPIKIIHGEYPPLEGNYSQDE
jgi:NIMA (never in mitosis gene a)-related kinase